MKENDSKIPKIHILLTNVHLDCRGKFPVTGNANRDESVEIGDKSVETKDKYIEAGEKHNKHVIITNNARAPRSWFALNDF